MITAGITLGLTAYLIVDAKRKATYKKMAYDAFQKAGAGGIDPSTYIKALQEELDKRTANAKLVVDASLGLDENGEKFASALSSLAALNAVITSDGLSTEDATKFKEAWDVVIDSLGKISKISYETIFAGLDEAIAHGTEEIRNAAKEYRTEILKAENIMNGLRGRLETELDFLQREILAGTDDPKVFERYEQIYNELANSTQSGLKDVTDAIEKGARFDFSHGENPIEEASQFISDGLNGTIQTGIDQVKAQYDAELEALNNVRNELETYKRLGIVDENSETYKRLVKLYDGLEETYKKNLENQLKELAGLKQGAYDTISRQAIEGYLSLDPTDENALKSYVENVFKPLKKAIEEAGGEVPEEVEAYIARNGQTLGDAIEMARATSRSAIYKSLFDDALYGNIEDGMTAAIGYEIDLVGGDTSKISEEARKEIISTLYDVFGDPEKIIEQFIRTKENGGAFEWSIEDIIGGFDLEGMDVDELNELLEAIQRVRNGIEEKLYGDAHRNPQDQEYLEWYEYQERMGEVATTYDALKKKVQDAIDAKNVREEEIRKKTSSVASAFEDMASRIKSAIGSLNGAGFSFSSIGLRGVINVNAIEKRASGGFVKSGDLVMANENGNFEMMGRMGNQPVVANNQQIVSGISQGVASANEGVEARLGSIETLLTRVLQKEFIAKATPSSGWGAMNERSGVAYDRVRG